MSKSASVSLLETALSAAYEPRSHPLRRANNSNHGAPDLYTLVDCLQAPFEPLPRAAVSSDQRRFCLTSMLLRRLHVSGLPEATARRSPSRRCLRLPRRRTLPPILRALPVKGHRRKGPQGALAKCYNIFIRFCKFPASNGF